MPGWASISRAPGSGEGNALTEDELRRVYRIGVEVCKGKFAANANPPETQTVWATREHLALAIESGVEMVNIYGLTGWHGFRPTDAEIKRFTR
jgi:dihydrodipicolinate synthase/N-acetylneuraminate lyase